MAQSRPQHHSHYWSAFERLTGTSFPSQDFVEFVLPDLERDLERGMYLTMKLAQSHPNPVVAAMYATAQDFFSRLAAEIRGAQNGDVSAVSRARRMASFPEAWEIGFGYTAEGRRGRGIGSGTLNQQVVDWLLVRPGMAEACAVEPDGITFIDGVGMDRSSDALATICKSHLIEFTQEQARIHNFRQKCMAEAAVRDVWSPAKGKLVTVTARLPVMDDGSPVLLVPKRIVRSSPPVRTHHYGDFYDLSGSGKSVKERIMEENKDNPDRLLRAMRKVFEDPRRYRPRREFRD